MHLEDGPFGLFNIDFYPRKQPLDLPLTASHRGIGPDIVQIHTARRDVRLPARSGEGLVADARLLDMSQFKEASEWLINMAIVINSKEIK